MKKIFTYLHLIRAKQYSKNLFLYLPAFFGGVFFVTDVQLNLLLALLAFCSLSSSIYIINDICDRNEDINHPTKKFRPIASGEIKIKKAIILAIGLIIFSFAIAIFYIPNLSLYLGCYFTLNLFYSLYAKHWAIIDVVTLALGFIIRIIAGSVAAEVGISQWLVLMVFLLSAFLALGKRWHDLSLISCEQNEGVIRKCMSGYSRDFLLVLMTFFSTINTICYIIYSIFATPTKSDEMNALFFSTSLWVVMGNMRYLQIIFVHNTSYSPTQTLIYDHFIKLMVLAWSLHVVFFIYLT